MKFKTKLLVGLGSILVIMTVLVVILLNLINQLTVNMSVVVGGLSERMQMASTIQYEINSMGRQLREMAGNPPEDVVPQIINDWEKSRVNVKASIESLKEEDNRKKSQELMTKLETLYNTYENLGQQVITGYQLDRNENFDTVLWGEARQTRQRMQQIMDLLFTLQEQKLKDELYRTRASYYDVVKIIYIFVVGGLLIGLGIIILFISRMTKNLNKVTSVMTKMTYGQGTHFPRIEITTKDEIRDIAEAFNEMAHVLENHVKQEKELKEKAEEHSWLKTKVAEVTSLYTSAEDFHSLAQLFITTIAPIVEAESGIFYIKRGRGDKQYLKKAASYALHDRKDEFDSFQLGEGLVGQCAIEKKPILITSIPDDYRKIVSGTSKVSAKNIMILPAEFEGEVLAVMEVASFKPFTPLQLKLMEEVMEHIGITINSVRNRIQVKKLLQESQALTEELQSQSEELQLQQEELRTTNEQLEEQYRNSELKNKELEDASVMLEEKAQQLALNSKYKSEFLANMSHELRTPLNSLLILAQMLTEKGSENLTAKQLEYIRTIYSSGNDLLYLINDILDLSKVESGKIDIVSNEVNLSDIKNFVDRQFTPIARQKGIQFHIKLDEGLPEVFHTDVHRLNQILKNLLSNAFKFTEKGSVSLLIQDKRKDDVKHPDSSILKDPILAFTVIDTGIGIPKEKQNLIFETFRQADGTTSRKYGGTGLGLSISKEIAQLLGGFIEVKSEEGIGSSFALYLSTSKEPRTENKVDLLNEVAVSTELFEESSQSEELVIETFETEHKLLSGTTLMNGKKILVVDDDVRNIFALTAALEENEMEVVFAKNGREGIEVLLENPDTDLVLMDIMMPEMDGYEAMRKIRTRAEFQDLPIIALTAKAMKHNREQCIEAGASDYISKPVNVNQLLSLMQVWLYR